MGRAVGHPVSTTDYRGASAVVLSWIEDLHSRQSWNRDEDQGCGFAWQRWRGRLAGGVCPKLSAAEAAGVGTLADLGQPRPSTWRQAARLTLYGRTNSGRCSGRSAAWMMPTTAEPATQIRLLPVSHPSIAVHGQAADQRRAADERAASCITVPTAGYWHLLGGRAGVREGSAPNEGAKVVIPAVLCEEAGIVPADRGQMGWNLMLGTCTSS